MASFSPIWAFQNDIQEISDKYEEGGVARQEICEKIENFEIREYEIALFFCVTLRKPSFFQYIIDYIKNFAYALNFSDIIDQIIFRGEERMLDLVLSLDFNINIPNYKKNTPLFHAVLYEDMDAIKKILKKGANPNYIINNSSIFEFTINSVENGLEMVKIFFETSTMIIDMDCFKVVYSKINFLTTFLKFGAYDLKMLMHNL